MGGTNVWSAHGFVYINDEMLMICILPVRLKEQPKCLSVSVSITSIE